MSVTLFQMCSLRETFQEYIVALTDAEKKIATCPEEVIKYSSTLRMFLFTVVLYLSKVYTHAHAEI